MSEEEHEYLNYISRSSTEFYLSGRYKSELFLTPKKIYDDNNSDSDDVYGANDSYFKFDSKFLPRPKLELPPYEIETRIEEFIKKFKDSGLYDYDINSHDYKNAGAKKSKFSHLEQLRSKRKSQRSEIIESKNIVLRQRRKKENVMGIKGFDLTTDKVVQTLSANVSNDNSCTKNQADVKQHACKQMVGEGIFEENCLNSCNFRVSWISNDSSTPSGPRQSVTSPSDNNFLSSSLTSSLFMEDEQPDDRWAFDFPVDNFDYPDVRGNCNSTEFGQSQSVVASYSRKSSGLSATSMFRVLTRQSSRLSSTTIAGRAMGESNCMLTILDVASILQKNFAFISGGKSRRDFALISFPECPSNSSISDEHFKSVISYLTSYLSQTDQESGVVVVVDRRQDKWTAVKTLLIQITNLFPTPVQKVYVLRPLGFLQKTFSDTGLKFVKEEFRVKILILDSLDILHDYIDKEQLTSEFGGSLDFNLSEWIQHRAALEKFSANATITKQNMLSICRDLQEREFPNDVTQTEVLMHDHETIKVEIEEDVLSTLNHGRVLVECFFGQEGSLGGEDGLKLLSKSKQDHVAAAQRLLVQIEEASKSFESFWDLHKVKLEQCLQLRKFEEDFKLLHHACDNHLKYLESLEIKCESLPGTNDLLSQLKKFEELSKNDIERADALKSCGEKFINENHYAVDCIRPKCSELERIVLAYNQLFDSGTEIVAKSKELFDLIENAERWCAKGVDFLASQAIDSNHSSENITKSISDLDSLIDGFKNLGFINPKGFHQKYNSFLTPQLKSTLESILSRSEDVHNMLTKCRSQLCSQIIVKPVPKPVHMVQPERTVSLSPPITPDSINGNTLSPFSISLVNLNTSHQPRPTMVQSSLQVNGQVEQERSKSKRKFSFKKMSKLERRFSKSTQNLESIRSKLSPNHDKEDGMMKRRSDIMAETIAVERVYVGDLQMVFKNYVHEIESIDMLPMLPEELVGRKRELFSNWSDILSFHSEIFLKELESAVEMKSIEAFCFSFIIHKDDLTRLYIEYSKNRMSSTELLYKILHCDFMKECQKKASTNESLDVLLSKPIKQLSIYLKLLKELVKCCSQDQSLESAKDAADTMGKLMEKSTSAMNIIAIEGFEGDISAGGRFIQQGSFLVQVEGGKSWGFLKSKLGVTRQLFLYESFIIICKKMEANGNGSPTYQFKALLPTSELTLTEVVKGDKKKFQLSLHKTNESYIVQASSINTKDFWVSEVKRILLGQFEKIKSDNMNRNSFKSSERSPSVTQNGFHPLNGINNNNNRSLGVNGGKTMLSSSLANLSKISGQTYIVTRNHSATRPDELSLAKGTEVVLIDPGEEGWSLVREISNPKREGWVPHSLLAEKNNSPLNSLLIKDNYNTWSRSNESLEQPA